jgi:hypothetical protein
VKDDGPTATLNQAYDTTKTPTAMNQEYTTKATDLASISLKQSYPHLYSHYHHFQAKKTHYEAHPNNIHYSNRESCRIIHSSIERTDQYRRYGIQAFQANSTVKSNMHPDEHYQQQHQPYDSNTCGNTKSSRGQYFHSFESVPTTIVHPLSQPDPIVEDLCEQVEEAEVNRSSYKTNCDDEAFGLSQNLVHNHHEDDTDTVYSFGDDDVTNMLLSGDF